MKVVNYLDVNGVMQGRAAMDRRFVLPDKTNVTRSLRFGAHAFALKETMQILPVGSYERLPVAKTDGDTPAKKIFKSIFNGCNVRSLLM
ncbi:MAG: hypothetical protein WC299_15845 [Kiritimatiellia bacterium]